MSAEEELGGMIGRQVVIDARAPYVYLGTLDSFTECFVTLRDVDVHDATDSHCTKEMYIMEARKLGVQRNRASVKILRSEIVSISLLSDVVVFE